MKVSIDPAVNVAAQVERIVPAIIALNRAGQQGAEVLNAQGHVRGSFPNATVTAPA